ncbi:MAG TPA: ribosome maturation factor RimP [Nitrospiraceae bacterium]|nr:ribosome maturation factor RimP [Nitrospiraceae bacterium]
MPTFLFDLLNELSKNTGPEVSRKESRPVVDRISEVVSPILWALGLELIDIVCVGQGARSIVRVYVDKSGGVTVEDCGRAHLAIGPALDVADPFPHAYTLEVSSPGLDRAFKGIQDYRRALGKQVNVKLRQPINGQWRVVGELMEVNEQGVTVVVHDRRSERKVMLEFGSITEARRAVTF